METARICAATALEKTFNFLESWTNGNDINSVENLDKFVNF